MNSDGRPDLVIANIGHNNVSILLANTSGGFSGPTTIAVGNQPRSVWLADLNGDQKFDLVTANFNDGTVSVLLGDGLGGFGNVANLTVPGFGPEYTTVGDFNNDGKPDLVVAYLNSSFVSVLPGNGAGGFGPATNSAVPFGAQQIAVGDFNGDGKADLAVPNISGLSVVLGNGNGTFGVANTLPTNTTATAVAVGDFNGDGKADLATTNGNNNQVLVFSGDGQGNFGVAKSFTTGSYPNGIAVADYNGDGNSDLAIANNLGTATILLGDGLGGFGVTATYLNGGGITRAITSGDFNSDGRADLAFANQGGFPSSFSPNSSILFNACSTTPPPIPTASIGDVTVTEGDIGILNANFNVTLSIGSSKTVSVSFYSADRDAFKGVDYQNRLGQLTFAPGVTSQTITVPIIGDTLDEFDEQFSVFLAHSLNANLAKAQGQCTIIDNDPPPTVAIGDVAVTEGNSGTVSANFVVSLSAPSGKPISLDFATTNGTAMAGSDYVSASGTTVFNVGETTKVIPVTVKGDTVNEPDEMFFVNLSNPMNVNITRAQGVGTILNDDLPTILFSSASYSVGEGSPRVDITLSRSGDTTGSAAVNYASNDAAGLTNCNVFNGTASPRCDYINTLGMMSFAAGETSKTFSIAIIDDSYAEGSETFTVGLNNASGATLGTQSTATVTITDNETTNGPNPIDNTNFFVRQQYIDFLGREPDPPGFAAWVASINNCTGDTTQCDRIHVSQLFFQSAEFQERGYFVYRFYPVAFGRKPDYAEFVPDLASVSGFLDANQLEAAKVAFIASFMARPAFANTYNPLNNTQYVDMLLNTAGVTLPSRQSMIDGLNSSTLTRAQVLRQIVESSEVSNKYNHQAYAVMEYFGYLRRQPDAFYLAWIAVLDQSNDPRGMVTGFVTSLEYRQRFGP